MSRLSRGGHAGVAADRAETHRAHGTGQRPRVRIWSPPQRSPYVLHTIDRTRDTVRKAMGKDG
ncbi:hypothetical protein GCM10010376_71940 [Streptomyces violaceusniger]